jgi:hypothetical protein
LRRSVRALQRAYREQPLNNKAMQNQTVTQTILTIIRWTARCLSILSIAGLGLFMFGEKLDLFRFQPFELLQFLFFPVGLAIGLLMAWRFEALGGGISIGSFVLFYLLNYAKAGSFPRGWTFFGFSIPGILFLFIWLQSKAMKRSAA